MNTNLLDYVLARLRAREVKWVIVARESGVPYETLKKIAHGRTPNPGVQHVQRLADFFASREPSVPVEEDAACPLAKAAATEIAHG